MLVFHAVRFISCHSSIVYAHSASECASGGVFAFYRSFTLFLPLHLLKSGKKMHKWKQYLPLKIHRQIARTEDLSIFGPSGQICWQGKHEAMKVCRSPGS